MLISAVDPFIWAQANYGNYGYRGSVRLLASKELAITFGLTGFKEDVAIDPLITQ
jgi:hypothetical protein